MQSVLEPGHLKAVFQPVFEIKNGTPKIHYLESLIRGPIDTNLGSASVLFEYVRRKGQETAVDRVCLLTGLEAAKAIRGGPALSFNVHASTLERDREFVPFLEAAAGLRDLTPGLVTLEIVEHAPSWLGPSFLKALQSLRDLGVRIALDDIGLGQSNFRMILDTEPDYFKVDAFLVRDCHADPRRQAILSALVELSGKFGSRVIAEGVESPADLAELKLLGIDLVQGFLLSPPVEAAQVDLWDAR
jgi:EAL domain-containing protein (putative c-di-GMP-specific phosphodiesterase class I)